MLAAKPNFAPSRFVTTHKDIEKVLAKSAEDLAESLEIMMIETRPIGDHRTILRGAICMLRDEHTETPLISAVQMLQTLKGLWMKKCMEARVLICQRAIEILEAKNAK